MKTDFFFSFFLSKWKKTKKDLNEKGSQILPIIAWIRYRKNGHFYLFEISSRRRETKNPFLLLLLETKQNVFQKVSFLLFFASIHANCNWSCDLFIGKTKTTKSIYIIGFHVTHTYIEKFCFFFLLNYSPSLSWLV